MKKKIIIGTIGIFALSFLFHSIYAKMPNLILSIFTPVNESIWEHGKMILTSFVSWMLIEKYIFKNKTNVIESLFIASIICILIEYLVFTPIFMYILKTKENMPVTLIVYAIAIFISLFIREKYLIKEEHHTFKWASIIGICALYIMYGILTYKPIKMLIFYDYSKNVYGIPNKQLSSDR